MLLKDDSMGRKGYKMTPFSSRKYKIPSPATTVTGNHQKETCTGDSANKIKQKEDLCKQTFGKTWGFGVFNC